MNIFVSPKQFAKQLRNIGPRCASQLIHAGIDTPEKLKQLGAKEVFLRMHRSGALCGTFHAAYLYALEGAITDCDWRMIPEKKKKEFKAFTAALREKRKLAIKKR